MKTQEQVKDLISEPHSPWYEFENNFEEGWSGNPRMVTISNLVHHKDVANRVANRLSEIYASEAELWANATINGEKIISDTYREIANEVYPNDKIWSGDEEDSPDFWREYFRENNICSKERAILWDKSWGPVPQG